MPVGPRMRSGDYYSKFPEGRKKRRASTRRAPAKKATTALIKSVLNRQLETKYVAAKSTSDLDILGKIDPVSDYYLMLAPVNMQTTVASSNVREGDIIKPISANISGHIWYDNRDTAPGSIVFVKLFFCQSKGIKGVGDLGGNLPQGLLESGAADPVPWTAAGQSLQAFYPVCKENYTLLKTKTFKLVKNGGVPIGNAPGHMTNIGKDRYPFSYSWKPPTLKFQGDGDNFPSNHAPFFFAVAYSPGYNYVTDPSLGVGTVKMNWQTSMSFKDA